MKETTKMYEIESQYIGGEQHWRWRSQFNDSMGAWVHSESYAIKKGEEHEEIIRFIFNREKQGGEKRKRNCIWKEH